MWVKPPNPLRMSLGKMSTLQRNTTVLVIEDNPLEAEILVSVIEGHGGTAVHTESKDLAHQLLSNVKFDLVTVDVQLSDNKNGLDLARELGLIKSVANEMPGVVVISSEEFDEATKQALKAEGFTDVLQKPLDQGFLINVLNSSNPRKALPPNG